MGWTNERRHEIPDRLSDSPISKRWGCRTAPHRIRDLELAMIIGRTRPQYAGPRTKDVILEILEATASEVMPWQV